MERPFRAGFRSAIQPRAALRFALDWDGSAPLGLNKHPACEFGRRLAARTNARNSRANRYFAVAATAPDSKTDCHH